MNKYIKSFLSLLLVLSLGLTLSASLCASALTKAEQEAQYKSEIAALEEKIKANDQKIADLKSQAASKQGYIDELQTQVNNISAKVDAMNSAIALVQADIDELDSQITAINNEIASLEAEIKRLDDEIILKQQAIAAAYEMLGQRIRALYLAGPTSELEYLLTTDSFELETFLARLELLTRVSEHDNSLIAQIYEAIDAIKQMQSEIDASIAEKNAKITELDTKKAELDAKKAEQVTARNEVQAEEDKIQASLDEINNYVSSLNAASAEYQRVNDKAEDSIAAFEKKIAALYATSGSGVVSTGMIWPVQGYRTYISSRYGVRTLNGTTRMHNGIDICISGQSSYGKPISAVADGTVIKAFKSGYNSGLGLYIVIDHGNGVQSYYCHCSSVYVSAGQSVTKGQNIAAIGSTGYSTGAHLHFAIVSNGSYQSPLNYVPMPSDCYYNE